jgi:hypothetical protein
VLTFVAFISSEKASPLTLLHTNLLCFFSKQQNCTNLVKLFFLLAVFKNTIVAASDPKALEILEANPNPVELLILS